jgi:hypothetical protein
MDIQTATRDFEKWVNRHTHVVKSQLSDKHKQMAESPVQFLRGTFYRWTKLFAEICPELRTSNAVTWIRAVGTTDLPQSVPFVQVRLLCSTRLTIPCWV